jgi:CubicO group peptidase (beta-lactamase class C family)
MRTYFYCLFIVCCSTYNNSNAQSKAGDIEKLMNQYAAYGQFNGVILVAEKGKIIYQRAFGIADYEWNIKNTTDTKFEIASITKSVTALMIMHLAERGKIDLNGHITDYLKDYPAETGSKITIKHLLTHTSGLQTDIADFPANGNNFPDIAAKINEDFLSITEQVNLIAKRPLLFDPGTNFNYSSDGYTVLGRIIEIICNKTYEQVLDSLIIKPLQLNQTGYKDHYTIIGKRAVGYAETWLGYKRGRPFGIAPSGGIFSTAGDLLKWEQALYTDKIITQTSKEIIFKKTPFVTSNGWKVNENFFNTNSSDSIKIVKCTGGLPGFTALVVRFLKDNKTIILLENRRLMTYRHDEISGEIGNILYNKPYTLPKRSLAKEMLNRLQSSGKEQAMKLYRSFKKDVSSWYLNEREINSVGYLLLHNLGKKDAALEFFKMNALEFPNSANVFDSLGEAYMENGDNKKAIENFKKSLELDPGNDNAKKMIEKLTSDK